MVKPSQIPKFWGERPFRKKVFSTPKERVFLKATQKGPFKSLNFKLENPQNSKYSVNFLVKFQKIRAFPNPPLEGIGAQKRAFSFLNSGPFQPLWGEKPFNRKKIWNKDYPRNLTWKNLIRNFKRKLPGKNYPPRFKKPLKVE